MIDGGPGADTIIDIHGPAVIRTGTGANYVYVRDGHADDTVVCGSRRTYVVADTHDRVRGRVAEGVAGAIFSRSLTAIVSVLVSRPRE